MQLVLNREDMTLTNWDYAVELPGQIIVLLGQGFDVLPKILFNLLGKRSIGMLD